MVAVANNNGNSNNVRRVHTHYLIQCLMRNPEELTINYPAHLFNRSIFPLQAYQSYILMI